MHVLFELFALTNAYMLHRASIPKGADSAEVGLEVFREVQLRDVAHIVSVLEDRQRKNQVKSTR